MKATVIVLLLAGLTLGSPKAHARASQAERKALARKLFEKGELHYQQGDFKRALGFYLEAQKAYRAPAFIFNIAQCHRLLGNYSKALFFYRLFLAEQPAAANRSEVKRRIRQMKKRLAALATIQRQKGRLSVITTPPGAEVFVDRVKGKPNASTPAILSLASGQHLVMIKKAGYVTVVKTVDVKARKVALVTITLKRSVGLARPVERRPARPVERRPARPVERRPARPVERRPARPVERRPARPVERRPARPVERRPARPVERRLTPPQGGDPTDGGASRPFYKRWWFWTGVGVAAATFAVAAYAGSTALSMQSEWDDNRGNVENPSAFKSRAKNLALVADVMMGVGAAAAIAVTVGAILVAVKRKKERPATTRVVPSCGAKGCGVWVVGRF